MDKGEIHLPQHVLLVNGARVDICIVDRNSGLLVLRRYFWIGGGEEPRFSGVVAMDQSLRKKGKVQLRGESEKQKLQLICIGEELCIFAPAKWARYPPQLTGATATHIHTRDDKHRFQETAINSGRLPLDREG